MVFKKFEEQFTLDHLDRNAISDITAEWLWDREHGLGQDRNVLHEASWRTPYLYVWYRTYPTYSAENIRVLSNGSQVRTEYYDSMFQFQDVENALGNPQEFVQMNEREQIDLIGDLIKQGKARTQCNCGAFFFQSHWEELSKNDHSIFKFPGPKGKGVWKARHTPGLSTPGISICKHIAVSIHRIEKDVPQITKAIIKQLRS